MDEQSAVNRAPPLQKYTLQPYYSIARTILRPYFRIGHEMQCCYTWSHDSIHNMMIRLGFCALFATFFNRFEANLSEYGSYSLYIICFGIFANTIYSHHSLHIRFKIFAHICMQIFIFSYLRIFSSKYSF